MIENKIDKYLNETAIKHFMFLSTETRKMINQFDASVGGARGIDVEKLIKLFDKLIDSAFEDGRVDAARHLGTKR